MLAGAAPSARPPRLAPLRSALRRAVRLGLMLGPMIGPLAGGAAAADLSAAPPWTAASGTGYEEVNRLGLGPRGWASSGAGFAGRPGRAG